MPLKFTKTKFSLLACKNTSRKKAHNKDDELVNYEKQHKIFSLTTAIFFL